jgi:RND family efflux transporter MFP subunit
MRVPPVVARRLARGLATLAAGTVLVAAPVVGMILAQPRETPQAAPARVADAAKVGDGHGGGAGHGAAGGGAHGGASKTAAAAARATPTVGNDFVAVLLPPRMAELSPRAERKVLAVRVDAGQAVAKGTVIVAFDLRQSRHELAIAQAQLDAARADAARANAELAAANGRVSRRDATVEIRGRAVPLVSGEEATQARFDAAGARARAVVAAARVGEHRAHVDQLRLALEENELRAPFDGIVSAVNVEPGTTARPGDVVARVVGGRGLRARIAVPEEAASLLSAARARLIVDGLTRVATVQHVTPEPEPAARVFIVEAAIDGLESACVSGCAALAGRTVRASLDLAP